MDLQTQAKINTKDNSLTITLPPELIEKLNITEGDTLIITENIDSITLSKYDLELETAMKIYKRGSNKYQNALKKLA